MIEREFRSTSKLVKGFTQIKKTPVWRFIWKTLWDEHPMNRPPERTVGAEKSSAEYQLGAIDGANRMLSLLVALSRPLDEGIELKATYDTPEEEL